MLKRQKLQYLVAGGRKGLRAEEYIHEVNTAHFAILRAVMQG